MCCDGAPVVSVIYDGAGDPVSVPPIPENGFSFDIASPTSVLSHADGRIYDLGTGQALFTPAAPVCRGAASGKALTALAGAQVVYQPALNVAPGSCRRHLVAE